jgi:hypothetical protein
MPHTANSIYGWIERSPDPARVARYLDEFAARHRAAFDLLAADPERARWLAILFGCSAFLFAPPDLNRRL